MKLVCSYCRADLGAKEPLEDERISHTMCEGCFAHFEKQFSGQRLGEYLDRFDLPVMAVDGDGRVVAANQQMADSLGKGQRRLFGLLGGEAMECANALLPGGCGKSIHCDACTIRMTVEKTRETGEPQLRVPAYIARGDGRQEPLRISTELRDGAVVVTMHDPSSPED